MYSEEFDHNGKICTTVTTIDRDHSHAFYEKKKTKKISKEGELTIVKDFDAITGDLLSVTETNDQGNWRLRQAKEEIEEKA